ATKAARDGSTTSEPASAAPGGSAGGGASDGTPAQPPDPRTVELRALADPAPAVTQPSGPPCVACRTGTVDADGYCTRCGHARRHERDHVERGLGGVAAVSDRGLRHHRNEDSFAVSTTALPNGSPAVVAVVCDGVSSATSPDLASATAA